jgi:hypothetical protein
MLTYEIDDSSHESGTNLIEDKSLKKKTKQNSNQEG